MINRLLLICLLRVIRFFKRSCYFFFVELLNC